MNHLKNNADKPAHPVQIEDWHGLTKREHFAGLAMQGMLAAMEGDGILAYPRVAPEAVKAADALLAELDK